MTLEYTIYEDLKLVFAKAAGTLTAYDLNSYIDQLSKDPGYIPPMLKLVDFSMIDHCKISNKEVEIFSRKKTSMARHFIHEKCAIVIVTDLAFNMVKLHQAFIDDDIMATKIFSNLEQAIKWLGVNLSN